MIVDAFRMVLTHIPDNSENEWMVCITETKKTGRNRFSMQAQNLINGRVLTYPKDYDAIAAILPPEYWPPIIEKYKPVANDNQPELPNTK